ncbi:MAG: hypothetical protein AABW68_00120 [archaeon]
MNYGKRGQSALEYLMTYGWALVVIVIAVAALVVLINPQQITGNNCDSKLGNFVISQSNLTTTQGQLVLVNQTGQGVNSITMTATGTGVMAGLNGTSLTPSFTTMNAGDTNTMTLPWGSTFGSGTYTVTFDMTYTAGNLSNLTATAQCRGTI